MTFNSEDLFIEPTAEIRNFHAENGGRDEYGNRVFSSADLAYLDREGETNKAALLVSEEGEVFIKKHKGILKALDQALTELETEHTSSTKLQLQNEEAQLSHLQFGGQSHVFLLNIGKEKYIIKSRIKDLPAESEEEANDPKFQELARLDQPYSNEMLQTQAFARDLSQELDSLGIEMNTFYFASGQMSCTRYIEDNDRYAPFKLNYNDISQLRTASITYIYRQQALGNHLWDGVELDLPENPQRAARNFIKAETGNIVWIDPFKVDKNPIEPGRRYNYF